MERTSSHVHDGTFWIYTEPNGCVFQPRGIFSILMPTRDFIGRRGITDDDTDNDFEYPDYAGTVQRAKLTGKRRYEANLEQEDVRTFAQYHYIVQVRPNCIRNWYSHRRFHNGCAKCRDYTSKLCRNCGYRIAAKPINDIQHLRNVVAYIKRKRDLAEAEPDCDPTPREGDKYSDEDEQIVLAKLASGLQSTEMDYAGETARVHPTQQFRRARIPLEFETK